MEENMLHELKETIKAEIKEELKQEFKENIKEEFTRIKEEIKKDLVNAGAKIDDKIEETAAKYQVPKWVVWLSGAAVVGLVIKLIV